MTLQRHSERARSGTRTQIDGIIEWLEDNRDNLIKERIKFRSFGKMGLNMIPHIDSRIVQIVGQIWEYKSLRAEYKARDLL